MKNIIEKKFLSYIIFFFINIIKYNVIKSFIILPLEYLPKEKYKSYQNENNKNMNIPKETMLHIFYKLLITKLDIGNPSQNISLFIKPNDDNFYIASAHQSKLSEEKAEESNFFKFSEKVLYNEILSNFFEEGICHTRNHNIYHFSEICESKDIINFNINNKIVTKLFPIKLVRNNDGNIPGIIGLLLNDSYYGTHREFINDLKDEKIIDNFYWFFHFNEISPLEQKIKGQFIIGAKPNEAFPDKFYSKEYKMTHPYV